jgi:hypothetical protein
LLSNPETIGSIDLDTHGPDFFEWNVELRITRPGNLHGIAGWFVCSLVEGVHMTNSPLSAAAITRPQAFLPIDEVVPVQAGDLVKVRLMARPDDNLIAWDVTLPDHGVRSVHSTWSRLVVDARCLTRTNPERVPKLTRDARARRLILSLCDGGRTAGAIKEIVLREYPNLLASSEEISHFVDETLARETEE